MKKPPASAVTSLEGGLLGELGGDDNDADDDDDDDENDDDDDEGELGEFSVASFLQGWGRSPPEPPTPLSIES